MADTWETKTPLAVGRREFGTAVYDGLLYIFGGYTTTYLSSVLAYDPASDSYTSKANMPNALKGRRAVVLGTEIHLFAGYNGAYRNYHHAYFPASDSYTTLTAYPKSTSEMGADAIAGIGYISGGNNLGATGFTYAYDPSGDSFTAKANCPVNRYSPAWGVVNGKFLFTVGYSGTTVYNHEYTPSGDSWRRLQNHPIGVEAPACGVHNGLLYVAGGYNSGFRVENYEYDLAKDIEGQSGTPEYEWVQKTDIPTARFWMCGGMIDGVLYVPGGYGPSGNQTVHEAYTAGSVAPPAAARRWVCII